MNLHSFFESKLALQLEEIDHYFLLPMDLHLKSSRFLKINIFRL